MPVFCIQNVYPSEVSAPTAYLCRSHQSIRIWPLDHIVSERAIVIVNEDVAVLQELIDFEKIAHPHRWSLAIVEAPLEVLAANEPPAPVPTEEEIGEVIEVPSEEIEVVPPPVSEPPKKKKHRR